MDAAASVIAVVQITEQVLSLCYKYAKGVKDARADIKRLHYELKSLGAILKRASDLLKGPYKDRLQTSQKLSSSLQKCSSDLDKLSTTLDKKSNDLHHRRHFFNRSRLKWPLETEEVEKAVRALQEHRNNLNAALTVDHTAVSLEHFERFTDDERLRILEWMSPIQYGKHHLAVKEKRTADTCEWLVQRDTFREWDTGNTFMILWLHGIPGAGKTHLTSRVIDHIQNRLHNDVTKTEGFAYFYCSRNEEIRRKPLSVFQSYARQLATVAGRPKLVQKHLRGLWQESRSKGQDLGMDQCQAQILTSVELYDKTTIVLDALDECELESRIFIMETIKTLLSQAKKPMRVFVSSRQDGDIRELFKAVPNIEILATDNSDDIKNFVHEEISKHSTWKNIQAPLREEIETTLLEESQGMFQWAYLQINQLLKLQTPAAIRNRLGKLPTSLKAAYDEIYGEISLGDDNDKQIADRAFMWVACAADPLNSVQLLEAVRWGAEDNSLPCEPVDQATLLSICKNLLVFDSQREVWRLSHLSVAEYFETHHWSIVQADCHIAKVCLGFLLVSKEVKTLVGYTFGTYAHKYWPWHVQTQEGNPQDTSLSIRLKEFLGSPTKSSEHYLCWFKSSKVAGFMRVLRGGQVHISEFSPPHHTILLICRLSLFDVLKDWWDSKNMDLLQTSESGETTLILAAKSGCQPLCEEIIKRGVNVNKQGGLCGSALAAAAMHGHTDVVQLLIKRGADVNASLKVDHFRYGSALAAASQYDIDIARTLCDHGADVNMALQHGEYGSALVAATGSEMPLETVRMLCDRGADVNLIPQCGNFGSVLEAAAVHGDLKTVQYLVQRGAHVKYLSVTGKYGSALAAAASRYKTDVMEYLISNGSPVDALLQCGKYGNALTAASASGSLAAVRLLLDNGANISLLPDVGSYGSPVTAAAREGHLETVKLLVETGAEIDRQLTVGDYGSPLVAAVSERFNFQVLEFLLEKGADINRQVTSGVYGSPLVAAAYGGGFEVVKFLVGIGAEIDRQVTVGHFGSPLIAAVSGRLNFRVLEFLLEKGAEIDQQLVRGDYGTPLSVAAAKGLVEEVKYLIEKGADVDHLPRVGIFGSALAAAALLNIGSCVEFLLQNGADVNLKLITGDYATALEAAESESPMVRTSRYWEENGYYWGFDKDNSRVLRLLREYSGGQHSG